MILRWESCAPFAMPVVPPVYCRTAKSSGSIDGLDRVSRAPFFKADLKLTAFGMWKEGTNLLMYFTTTSTKSPFTVPSISPICVTIMCFAGRCGRIVWRWLAKLDKISTAVTPASLNWCSISRGVYSGFVLTTIRPAFNAPMKATGNWSRLGIWIAMRSPFFSPNSTWR